MIRACDWIANYLYSQGVTTVHGLMGGGSSGINDGFIKYENINYICYHHEQGAGHGAIGEAKFTGNLAVVNPTTGCGGTNCITSVLNAWQDAVPVLFLSGNVRLDTCSEWINKKNNINIRKYGVQENHIIENVKSICKKVIFVTSVNDIPRAISQAVHLCKEGRPGPVWVDIPSDLQTSSLTGPLVTYTGKIEEEYYPINFKNIKTLLNDAKRPVVLAGNGIRQSNTIKEFNYFITNYELPYVSTYGARDYSLHNHHLNIGAVGLRGSRAGNFAMQNSDLLLVLGSSLGASVVGYDPSQFSPNSKKIMVDIEYDEMIKDIIKIDRKISCSLKYFFDQMDIVRRIP
jgi:acetolactate synthase-1/2/3 large subunit